MTIVSLISSPVNRTNLVAYRCIENLKYRALDSSGDEAKPQGLEKSSREPSISFQVTFK